MKKLKFIDFCSWIWWWRIAAESLWFKCLWYSEIDKSAIEWYKILHWNDVNFWDLMCINSKDLPDFDLMIAGFPCQSFSIVWKRSWLNDERWRVIFWLLKILKEKDIPYFLFENVKWLQNIESWKVLENIISSLEKMWYVVEYRLLNTKDFWLPHSRERVYIFWRKKELWELNIEDRLKKTYIDSTDISNFLIDTDKKYIFNENSSSWSTFIKYLNNKYNKWKYNINDLLKVNYLVLDTRQSDLRLYNWYTPTLRKWRHWIYYVKNGNLRKLSGYESILLQWFSKDMAWKLKKKLSDSKILSLSWNAMSVNVVKNILSLYTI
jgi:DNA (cytosine-5)-methyltransferase 1